MFVNKIDKSLNIEEPPVSTSLTSGVSKQNSYPCTILQWPSELSLLLETPRIQQMGKNIGCNYVANFFGGFTPLYWILYVQADDGGSVKPTHKLLLQQSAEITFTHSERSFQGISVIMDRDKHEA